MFSPPPLFCRPSSSPGISTLPPPPLCLCVMEVTTERPDSLSPPPPLSPCPPPLQVHCMPTFPDWMHAMQCTNAIYFPVCSKYVNLTVADFCLFGADMCVYVGEDGPSQMGLEDLAIFRAIPTATVFYPSDGVSTEKAVELAANTKVPTATWNTWKRI